MSGINQTDNLSYYPYFDDDPGCVDWANGIKNGYLKTEEKTFILVGKKVIKRLKLLIYDTTKIKRELDD